MKHTITKNDKNLKILNNLIAGGFYKGFIENEKFELKRNSFPNNYRIIGILNDSGKYKLVFDYKSPMNFVVKIFYILGTLFSVISIIRFNWIIPMASIVLGLLILLEFKLKEKREFKYFNDRFLEFLKREFD